jgi:hypothetical protein
MGNWSEQGVLDSLASRDKNRIAEAKRVLKVWHNSGDEEKKQMAERVMVKVSMAGINYDEELANEKRKSEIYSVFFAAHPEISDNVANRNLLETFAAHNGGVIILDILELAAEQLQNSLAKQRVPGPELTPEQALRAKLNAQRMRETWLRSLSTEELRKVARDEEQARKHGQDVNKDLRLTQEEKELLESQPKVSTTAARMWVPDSNPRREYTRPELLKLDARTIRSLITNGGHQLDLAKQQRFNDILGGVQPEGVAQE